MNWKCKIGLHDWEYLSVRGMVYKRICLRCTKYEDTMTPLQKETEEQMEKDLARKRLAAKLFMENQNG